MTTLFVRRDIWSLEHVQAWHPVTLAYAYAVREMTNRSVLNPNDPTGWSYQASVHGLGEGEPALDQWRNQCQHSTWFFLPWHRMYLLHFEQIARSIIQGLPMIDAVTKAQWALPYWDYDRGGQANTLPMPFRQPRLPSGEPNPLYVAQRNSASGINVNLGDGLPDGRDGGPSVTTARFAFQETAFAYPTKTGEPAGFGGPEIGPHHQTAGTSGSLETTPHNDIHDLVGGPTGFMSDVGRAALDPIFWLHHTNIDRLWVAWLLHFDAAHDPTPTDVSWRDRQVFHFHDQAGLDVTHRSRDILDPHALGYRYQNEVYPPVPPPAAPAGSGPFVGPDIPAELVGATAQPIRLTGHRIDVHFGVSTPSGPLVGVNRGIPRRVFLNVEGLRANRNPGRPYGVYVNLPDGGIVADHHVGNVSFFGIEHTTDDGQDHPGGGHGGLRLAFDITPLYQRLRATGHWPADRIAVTLVPVVRPVAPIAHQHAVRIGRISVYVK